MDDFTGLRVLVTGASSGIGAGLAEEFARRGATVGLCARRRDRLAAVLARCQTLSPQSRMWVADLADPKAADGLIASVLDDLGGVDILVNNAGIPKRRHVTRLDMATVESVMNINYLSPVRLTLGLLPSMLNQGRGQIINISSIAATLSSPGESAYDASKAALTAFSESMAVDLWSSGLKVLVVYPGLVDTELFSLPDNDPVLETAITPISVDELVAAVFEGLAADASRVYAPQWFADIATQKAQDLDAFLAGSAAYVAEQRRG
jgi:short-subunit dehydrogenase